MLILASDSSTKTASVALLRDSAIVAESFINIGRNHGETFLPEIVNLLSMGNTRLDEIDLFVVTIGPGSFTGLRIGLSTVKGLAFATGRSVVGVSTLETLASNLSNSLIAICPMLDARKGEVYTALYRPEEADFPKEIVSEGVTDPGEFLKGVDEDVIFIGDGALSYTDIIRKKLPGKSHFALSPLNYIRASSAGLIGLKKFRDGDILDLLTFTPRYLRVSEAEAKGKRSYGK
jgi:tRNA threonylcarbamoyladenosine biosynthesis protein TsaB